MTKTSIKFDFENGRGQKLAGIIDMPQNPQHFGVFAPCFTCIKESHGAVKICRELAARGVAMLRFDMTGLGGSEGDFAETHFTSRVADIQAAAKALAAAYAAPDILIGHSISGTAALSAVAVMPSIRLLATVGSPADPQGVIEKFRTHGLIDESGDGDVVVNVLGRQTPFRRAFVADLLAATTAADTARIDRDILVFHAPNDDIVHYRNAETIAGRNSRARLIRMADTATHLFEKGDSDAAFVADEIIRQID